MTDFNDGKIDHINYGDLIDDAMRHIIKDTLSLVVDKGLPGNHHFFVSFLTYYPGVEVSEKLRSRYPGEITIILQHQFEELCVEHDSFSVVLSFGGIKECVVVPFRAITAFADPSVRFGLQFRPVYPINELMKQEERLATMFNQLSSSSELRQEKSSKAEGGSEHASSGKKKGGSKKQDKPNNVVHIDFSKKPKK